LVILNAIVFGINYMSARSGGVDVSGALALVTLLLASMDGGGQSVGSATRSVSTRTTVRLSLFFALISTVMVLPMTTMKNYLHPELATGSFWGLCLTLSGLFVLFSIFCCLGVRAGQHLSIIRKHRNNHWA
jgi:hypothetical protein